MSSFTSSFRRELKVVTALVCLLLAVDVGMRFFEDNLSLDIRHIKAIPQILEGFKTSKARHILFLGNSLTRSGVDLELFNRYWSEHNLPKTVFLAVYPDGTTIIDWYYLVRYNIEMRQVPVDLIVVGFISNQIADNQPLHLDRLGGYFGGLSAMSEAFTYDVTTIGDRVDFLLFCLSRAYVNRERIKSRVLAAIIPKYRESAQVINQPINRRLQNSADKIQTYNQVKRLLAAAGSQKITLVFVAMPFPKNYQINNSLKEAIHSGGGFLLDLRDIENLKSSDYLDGYHLAPHGAQLYSSRLIQKILSQPELQKRLGVLKVDTPGPEAISPGQRRTGYPVDPIRSK